MKNILALLVVCVALASGEVLERSFQRIVGGSPTTINQYPYAVVIQRGPNVFSQWCGGSILIPTAVLSAAHCFESWGWLAASQFRIRVGSSFSSSGGTTHSFSYLPHPGYNSATIDNDVVIIRPTTPINYIGGTVAPVSIAGTNYFPPDNAPVWAIGWGATQNPNENPETLRHVQVYVVNQAVCRQRYGTQGLLVSDGMICSGVLDVGGRDQCQGDSGGPLLHNNVQVGICSWGIGCAQAFFPGVNARVSFYSSWIVNNA